MSPTSEFKTLLKSCYDMEDYDRVEYYTKRCEFITKFINPFMKENIRSIDFNKIEVELLYRYLHDKVHEQRHSKDKDADFVFGWILSKLKTSKSTTEILSRPHIYDNRTLLQEVCSWQIFKPFVIDMLIKRHNVDLTSSGDLVKITIKATSSNSSDSSYDSSYDSSSDSNTESIEETKFIKVDKGVNCLFLAVYCWLHIIHKPHIKATIVPKIITIIQHITTILGKEGLQKMVEEEDSHGLSVANLLLPKEDTSTEFNALYNQTLETPEGQRIIKMIYHS